MCFDLFELYRAMIRKDFDKLAWVIRKGDPNQSWYFERADGSYTEGNLTLFWYGIEDLNVVKKLVGSFCADSRIFTAEESSDFPVTPSTTMAVPPTSGARRGYSTLAATSTSNLSGTLSLRGGNRSFQSRSYTTQTARKVGIIGARGYTGQELIKIIDRHPNLELSHVSSRELAGTPVKEYTSAQVSYTNLSPSDLTKFPDVSVWVLALPNNICRPFVSALKDAKPHPVVVDLSADHRFGDAGWLYGLPELYSTRSVYKKGSGGVTLISNPGCYATGSQLALAPFVKEGVLSGGPSIFGVSGFSGAGTTPSPKNDINNLRDNLIPYALTDHM
jgi:N-acetyl-gamma-glutamyl-phosphate reductase / acetylglutamate kinase